ncbi:MAG: hypothetical protein RL346_245 [Verrucomicrobiota bacterium]|jgi:hypothetical protein
MASMKIRLLTLWMLLLAWMPSLWAGGDKDLAQVTFHLETEASDNPKVIFPYELLGKQRFFRKVPEITSKDFEAFHPFPSEDQASYGILIKLKGGAGKRLTAVTTANQGKYMVCQAFGRLTDGLLIDQPVNDGMLVIWKGLVLEEIRELDKVIPRIGEKKE